MKKRKLWWGAKQEYTPLKYLESTSNGTYTSGQYIDTGLDYFADFEITAKQRESAGMKALATITTYCLERENATTNAWRFRNGSSTFFTTSLLVTDLHTLKWKGGKVYGDGVELGSFTKTSNTGRMYLFGAATENDATRINRYPLQISSCRMWNPSTGELVRDYIPVLDTNGTPCMLDRVENKLYYNQGDGDFLYEEWDCTPVDCVYANGNAYTSTMLYGNSNTKMEMVFDIAEQSTQNRGSMGSRGNSANSQLLAIGYGTSTLATDFNNSSYSPYRAYVDYDTNTKYRIYTSKEKRSIIDEATGTVLAENNTLCTNNMSTGVLLLGAETGLSYRHVGNIYGAKIWDGATLARDFIPAVDSYNKGCFYDRCLNILFYSLGSSDFEGHIVDGINDYKVVHYLQSSGTQYIDTGWSPQTNNIRIETKVVSLGSPNKTAVCGAEESGVNPRWVFVLYGQNSDTTKTFPLIGDWNNKTDGFIFTNNKVLDIEWEADSYTTTITDKVTDTTYTYTYEETMNLPDNTTTLKLFQNGDTQRSSIKMYRVRIDDDKKKVRNMLPALKGSTAGMIDTINKQWYTNAGTGSFTTG